MIYGLSQSVVHLMVILQIETLQAAFVYAREHFPTDSITPRAGEIADVFRFRKIHFVS